jgi:hypothetical protein
VDTPAQRDPDEVLRNIEGYKRNIRDKTAAGRELSERIGREIEPDMYLKLQRYEIFINKMDQLYRNELRFKRKLNKKYSEMRLASVYSLQPLKDILRHYNELSARGFNSEVVANSLQLLLQAVRGRGN